MSAALYFLKIKHDYKKRPCVEICNQGRLHISINRIANQQHITFSAVATVVGEGKENGTEFFQIGIKRKLLLTEGIIQLAEETNSRAPLDLSLRSARSRNHSGNQKVFFSPQFPSACRPAFFHVANNINLVRVGEFRKNFSII